jgi:hypothetical protein
LQLEGYDPVLLIFDVGLGELDQIYHKQELALLGYSSGDVSASP